jgi:hypothetical protein
VFKKKRMEKKPYVSIISCLLQVMTYSVLLRYYLPITLVIISTVFSILLVYQIGTYIIHPAYAFSPSFSKQEIQDPPLDWVNMKTKQFTSSEGERSTDILAVDYHSNGKKLNATLWLYFPFNDKPSHYKTLNYGMLIDSDFDKTTGYDGIDYKLEIAWDNQTKTWIKKLEQWSPNGDQRTLNITYNYSGFFEKEKKYVLLSLDLGSLLYPTKYKVTFYAEAKDKNDILITDFTRWVAIPPLELTISTSPSNLILTPGEQKTIEVKVNSTKGYEPMVNLSAMTPSNNIHINFKRGFDKLKVPTYGMATTHMTISTAYNASIAPYSLTIFANSSFPPDQLITVNKTSNRKSPSSLFPPLAEQSQNIVSQSTMAITVEEPIPLLVNFVNTWITPAAGILTFVAGVGTVLTPFIIHFYNKKRKKIDNKNNNKGL